MQESLEEWNLVGASNFALMFALISYQFKCYVLTRALTF